MKLPLRFLVELLFLVVVLVVAIILPSLIVGLIISILQAATQINEQTLSFLPRLDINFYKYFDFWSLDYSRTFRYFKIYI